MSIALPLPRLRLRIWDLLKALIVLGVGGPVLVGGTAAAVFFFFPLPAIVPSPTPGALAATSHVYAADGSLIANFHSEHNRELIRLKEMPLSVQQAAIASEDSRFYEHNGLDVKAITRALVADFKANRTVQGGSTITQQYVKNAFLDSPQRTVFRKVREALIASQLERTYTKNKILENYLNTVYLGKGAYGVEAASRTYFNKPASQMSLSESAMVVGIIPAPVRYSPYENPTETERRRLLVLRRMREVGFIDVPTEAAAAGIKPALAPIKEEVFRFPWFVDALKKDLIDKYGEGKVFAGGLNIYSTIDPNLQVEAEKVLYSTLDKPNDPNDALVTIEPKTGYVRALVGGRQYSLENQFNLAIQARRQPGSAFKPFVLVAALNEGIPPTATFRGPSKYCELKAYRSKDGCVHNFANESFGTIDLGTATAHSVNTVFIQMANKIGIGKVVAIAKKMGISERSLKDDGKNLAVALGGLTQGVTPMEMSSAYATLAANGVYRKPKFVSRITTGDQVVESGPSDPVQAIDPNVAANANRILTKVITSGTARRADIGRPAAGKTGTAQDFKNAWFCGYTPDLSTVVWMGYRLTIPMTYVHGVRNVTGGTLPAQMWAEYMKFALNDTPPSEFEVPGKITKKNDQNGFGLPPRSGFAPSPTPEPPPEEQPSPQPTYAVEPSPSPSSAPDPGVSILPGASPSPSPSPGR